MWFFPCLSTENRDEFGKNSAANRQRSRRRIGAAFSFASFSLGSKENEEEKNGLLDKTQNAAREDTRPPAQSILEEICWTVKDARSEDPL